MTASPEGIIEGPPGPGRPGSRMCGIARVAIRDIADARAPGGPLIGVSGVVQGQEPLLQRAAGHGADGEAAALRGGVEVVAELEVGPAVGVANDMVKLDMELA